MTGPQGMGPLMSPFAPGYPAATPPDHFTDMVLNEGRTSGQISLTRNLYMPEYEGTTPQISIGTDSQAGNGVGFGQTQGLKVIANLPGILAGTKYEYHYDDDKGNGSGSNNISGLGSGDLRVSPYARSDRKVVAGAAGGFSSAPGSNGPGGTGGLPGGNGGAGTGGAGGGTQSAGGAGSSGGEAGDVDGVGFGGDGFANAGAGGGGYHGGGGGGDYGHSGGGGSSFIDGTFATNPSTSALQAHPYVGDVILTARLRDPKASNVQRLAGAELVYGFHEPIGGKFYNLFDGAAVTPTGTTNNTASRGGRRATASPNDRFWRPAGAGNDVRIPLPSGTRPPASASNTTGWMCEGFFRTESGAIENGNLFKLETSGGTQRFMADFPWSGLPTDLVVAMTSTAGTLKATTSVAVGAIAAATWYHILLRLTASNQWQIYLDGVLKSSWAHSGDLQAEQLNFMSNGGGTSSRYSIGCFAVHSIDRYTVDYIPSVLAAWNEV